MTLLSSALPFQVFRQHKVQRILLRFFGCQLEEQQNDVPIVRFAHCYDFNLQSYKKSQGLFIELH